VLTADEVCGAKVADPQYNLDAEAALVISRLASLDDKKKVQVEFFNNKFTSLIPLLVQYTAVRGINAVRCGTPAVLPLLQLGPLAHAVRFLLLGRRLEQFNRVMLCTHSAACCHAAMPLRLEPNLLLRFRAASVETQAPTSAHHALSGLIRFHLARLGHGTRHLRLYGAGLEGEGATGEGPPPAYIKAKLGGSTFNTYRGPSASPGPIKGTDFEAYIRVMPHAEFPSGSSCNCRAFVNALGIFEGLDLSQPFPPPFGPLTHLVPAGSSIVEPGRTPATNVLLTYSSWNAVAEACGQSRLDGGMHFTTAVPTGEELCAFAGDRAGQYALALKNGDTPANAPNIDNKVLTVADTRIGQCTGNRGGQGDPPPPPTEESTPPIAGPWPPPPAVGRTAPYVRDSARRGHQP
jgi:hypothetical protein